MFQQSFIQVSGRGEQGVKGKGRSKGKERGAGRLEDRLDESALWGPDGRILQEVTIFSYSSYSAVYYIYIVRSIICNASNIYYL